MSEVVDEVHRVSVSIQYSDYSSGEEVTPEPTHQSQSTVKDTDTEDTADDSLSSTSSSESEEEDIALKRQHSRKRTTKLIETKLLEITSKLSNDALDDTKELEATVPQKSKPRGRARALSTSEKMAGLASRWQRLVQLNSSQKALHESQKTVHPRRAIGSLTENGLNWKAVHSRPKHVSSRSSSNYKELSPQQLWRKRKEERATQLGRNHQHKPMDADTFNKQRKEERHEERLRIESEKLKTQKQERIARQKEEERKRIETERLQKQKAEEDHLERLRIETERIQFELDQLQKLKEKERLKQIETERLEKERMEREFEAEKERLRQIQKVKKQHEAAERLRDAIALERNALKEEEERKRAESIEKTRIREMKEDETQRVKKEKEERRRRKQAILNRKRKRMEETERRKKEVDRDTLMQNVYNHFVYDDESILNGENILLYLQKRLGLNVNEERVLSGALTELFGDEVVSQWGYYLRLL